MVILEEAYAEYYKPISNSQGLNTYSVMYVMLSHGILLKNDSVILQSS